MKYIHIVDGWYECLKIRLHSAKLKQQLRLVTAGLSTFGFSTWRKKMSFSVIFTTFSILKRVDRF